MLRIAHCDDDAGFRALVRATLDDEPDMELVGSCCDGAECIERAPSLAPDVVLLDLAMPRLNGLDALPRLRVAAPAAKIVVLSSQPPERFERAVRLLGAAGFIQKGWTMTSLADDIRRQLRPAAAK